MKIGGVVFFLTWRAAALPEGTSGNCCSCWSACCPAALSYQTSARREGSSNSTQDMMSARTRGRDCSLGQSKLEAGCPRKIESKFLPLITTDTNNFYAQQRDTKRARKRRQPLATATGGRKVKERRTKWPNGNSGWQDSGRTNTERRPAGGEVEREDKQNRGRGTRRPDDSLPACRWQRIWRIASL